MNFSAACLSASEGDCVNPNFELSGVQRNKSFYREQSPWYGRKSTNDSACPSGGNLEKEQKAEKL